MHKVKRPVIAVVKNSFSKLLDSCNKTSEHFIRRKEKSNQFFKIINHLKSKFLEGGGEKARIKHVEQNKKLLVSDRLNLLFDNGKYLEIGFFVGYGQSYGNIPRAGCITAIGKINNRICLVTASDATVKAGAVFPIQLKKQLRLQNLSINLHFPFIFLVDSAGAFLPLQSDIFPDKEHGGRCFYSQAIMNSKGIPVISLALGSCTAGGAYIPTMCSENGMVLYSSHIFLGGPPLVKAATGEIISAEDLGGAVLHSRTSGCSDHLFLTESEGISNIREMVSSLPNQTMELENLETIRDPLYSPIELDGLLLNYGTNDIDSRSTMIQIIARILDGSDFHEFKPEYGESLITGFGKISGYSVGIIACHDSLSINDSLKGSHFIQLCGHRKVSIISLVHTSEESTFLSGKSDDDHKGLIIKSKSLMMRSMATRNCKMITVVVGDAVGFDYICLGGKSMEPDFLFAWPNSRFGWTKDDLKNDELSSVAKAAGDMTIDEVIEPSQTRSVLTSFLEILHTKSNLLNEAHSQPVYRF